MNKKDVYANIANVIKPTIMVLLEMLLFVGLYVLGEIYVPLSKLRTMEFY